MNHKKQTEHPCLIVTQHEAEDAIRTLLRYAGDDPAREGLLNTPKRVAKAYAEYFQGYQQDPAATLSTKFKDTSGYSDIVLLQNIPFYSHCEHHMAPILGTATVAYLPNDCVVGISKLARVVEIFARRLQIQEKMTAEIANCIQENLNPKGVAVYIDAVHHCMMGRGVDIQGATLITRSFTGVFLSKGEERASLDHLLSK